ncbi:MAG: hypothetical protein KBS76_02015 [Ruminococcus sp.]|nr:hypothetical protein [Candidatus Apopatosoma intestinale]
MRQGRIKLFCLFLVFSMVLACFASCGQDRTSGETIEELLKAHGELTAPTFLLNNVSAMPGDQNVAVVVYVKNNPGIASIALTLSYDTDVLHLAGYEFNPQIGGQYVSYHPDVSVPKLVWLNWSENVDGDWVFATLYFDISKNAPQGTFPVSVTYNPDDVYNFAEENITFGIIGGSVAVK